jgi:hypothetical protein
MKGKKQQRLSKRQLAVIEDLFGGSMEELQVLEKHKVGSQLYRKWLADELFADELRFRIESAKRAGELIIARYTPMAAAKLVALTESDKAETVRKACIDIMSGLHAKAGPGSAKGRLTADADSAPSSESQLDLPPALASKLLQVLAQHADDSATS